MMFQTVRPASLAPFAARVFDALEAHTTFPWAALKTQCGWRGIDPALLEASTLAPLIPHIAAAVARVTDRDNGNKLMAQLWRLVDEARGDGEVARRDMPASEAQTTDMDLSEL